MRVTGRYEGGRLDRLFIKIIAMRVGREGGEEGGIGWRECQGSCCWTGDVYWL